MKEEIANVDTAPHPAETYVATEADIGTKGNSHTALDWETEKSEGDLDGTNERDLWRGANPPIVQDEIASAENQLERDWIRVVGVVPNADPFPNGVVEGSKQPDVAVPTQGSRKGGHLDCHHFYSISPVYLGHGFEAVLRLTASSRNAALSCKR